MFFSNKKKLIEMDNKINLVLEQLKFNNQKQEELITRFTKIEDKLDLIGERITDNQRNIYQCVKETENSIMVEVSNLKDGLKILDSTLENQTKLSTETIVVEGATTRSEMEVAVDGVVNKLDVLDSSLRLLLLNSVMEQIRE